jgi:hypothetical protein
MPAGKNCVSFRVRHALNQIGMTFASLVMSTVNGDRGTDERRVRRR